MHLDIVLPDESPAMPIAALVDLAQQADDFGFRTAYLPDHVLPPGEYGPTFGGVYEPLITIGHLGAVTRRIRFGTSVLVLPLRNPFVLAKQVATLQHSTGGRFVLGVGIGWAEQEFAAVEATYHRRGADTDDALAVIRHLFTAGRGPYRGRRYSFDEGVFAPMPTEPVPVLIGGNSDAALRRAARHGDLWQGLPLPAEQYAERVEKLAGLAAETDDRRVSPGVRIGWENRSAEQVAEVVHAYAAAGAEHVAVHLGEFTDYPERMTALAAHVGR